MATLRIGNGAGFWGDQLSAPARLAEQGRLDCLTLEYLAELTMSILALQLAKNPAAGFVTDFPPVVESLTEVLSNSPDLTVVTNAGGMNPQGCAAAISPVLQAAGLGDLPVAVVTGDNLYPRIDTLLAAGETLTHLDDGTDFSTVRSRLAAANAYLGAEPIAQALAAGARIVITGRVADASLTVGPAMARFGWQPDDWDRLATAAVAGHLIECGAQVTGGMFSEHAPASSLADIGYPIAELDAEGSLVITKPPGSGGEVTVATVAEQLVYEIGDPSAYLTPDVTACFADVRLEQEGPDRVRVTGARGLPRPETLKVSMAYQDGYLAAGTLVLAGPHCVQRAREAAQAVRQRMEQAGFPPAGFQAEVIGAGDLYPGGRETADDPWEVTLRVAVRDPSRETVERFTRELAPLVTSGPPGVTGYTGGRPRPRQVLSFWPATVRRELVPAAYEVRPAADWASRP